MLLFLSLLSTALAAPQLYNPYYGMYQGYQGYYPGYPVSGYPGYPVAGYPGYPTRILGYPGAIGAVDSTGAVAAGRQVVKFGTFLEINGKFERDATQTVPWIVQGNFQIQQNGLFDLFSSGEAKFKAYIQSSRDLQGENIMVELGTGATCAAAITANNALTATQLAAVTLATVNAPISFNGFYISGTTVGHNIDGSASKTTLKGATKWLMIRDRTGVIGCSMNALQ